MQMTNRYLASRPKLNMIEVKQAERWVPAKDVREAVEVFLRSAEYSTFYNNSSREQFVDNL